MLSYVSIDQSNQSNQSRADIVPIAHFCPDRVDLHCYDLGLDFVRTYAARGADSRQRYPWGDDQLTPEHANSRASGLGRPAPVGCFPKGRAAMSGAEDLVGNIVEWLATGANTASEVKPMSDCPPDEGILLTWGDWSDEEEHLYCGSRYRFNPNLRYSVQGFRVVWSRALIE